MQTCKICGNKKNNRQFQIKEMMYDIGKEFAYFQCSNCQCLQIVEVPADMSSYYPSNYYSFNFIKPEPFLKKFIRNIRNQYAVFNKGILGKILYKFRPDVTGTLRSLSELDINTKTSILDVGCGQGALLHALHEIGFSNLLGVDPFLSEEFDNKSGLKILKKDLAEVEGLWDLIMFHHSFEHIENELKSLNNVNRLLSDDGVCLIRVPVVSSFAWRNYGVNWVQLDAPRHFYLHSLKSMSLLANNAGFNVEKVMFDSGSFQFTGSELYSKGISLVDPATGQPSPEADIFTAQELQNYSLQAEQLNSEEDGDQAVFYLRKIAN